MFTKDFLCHEEKQTEKYIGVEITILFKEIVNWSDVQI